MTKDNGGNAFPTLYHDAPGMTLRDWFAGQALASMPDYLKPMQTDQRIRMAEWAYGLADALIAERSK